MTGLVFEVRGVRLVSRAVLLFAVLGLSACGNKEETDATKKVEATKDEGAATQVKYAPYRVDSFCPEICQRTRELRCRAAARCDAMCRAAFADMACPTTLRTAMDCALAQPLTSWTCSQDGIGAVIDGPCDAPQAAYDACLTALPK